MNELKIKEILPIFEQIAENIRQQILSGKLAYGMKLPPEPELAKRFNSSRETLRKAYRILEEQSLIAKRKGKGTFVIYRGDAITKKRRIGIISAYQGAPGKDNYYFSRLLRGVTESFPPNSFEAVFCGETKIPGSYQREHLDGILIINPIESRAKKIANLSLGSIPHVVVSVSYDFLVKKDIVCLDTDNTRGAEQATEYLIKLGHQRIGYLGGDPRTSNVKDRFTGYQNALKKHGLSFAPELSHHVESEDLSREISAAIHGFFRINPAPPTAIFGAGLNLSLECLKTLKNLGAKVPENVSIIGFDDEMFCEYTDPPLTTIKQPTYQLGKKAGELLVNQIDHHQFDYGLKLLDTELIIRNSCLKVKS